MKASAATRLILLFAGLLLFIGATSIGFALYLSADKSYTVYDGSIPVTVSGRFQTVTEVIEAAAISLRPEDRVNPALDETADPETAIQIERAKPVMILTADGAQTIWTQEENLQSFLAESGIQLQADQQILIDQQPVAQENLAQQAVPSAVAVVPREISVSLVDGQQQQEIVTRAETVAGLLQEAGMPLEELDRVDPAPGARLVDGAIITIERAIPVTLRVDGQVLQMRGQFHTPADVLREAGVSLGEGDHTSPAVETALQAGDTVEVIRVTNEYRFEDEEIPYQTVYQPSEELDLDSKAVLSNGAPGTLRRRYRLNFENGVQIGETLEEEWVEVEPVNQVIGYGTKITLNTIDTPEGPREYWRVVRMRATAYTAASSGKAPDHPNYGITASGRPAGTGVVAADPHVVPFRSEVYVPGYGIGYVGDTGGGVKGRWIDLGYDEDELVTWNGYADVYYLTPVPEDINYLIPEVLP